jgi:trans-2,3-dihydro-3-hydroxyanthranilate isomerase
MQLSYMTVDVFSGRRFGGNPLAVATNAQGLATDEMQSIACEFNLAETAFVLPPRDPSHTAEVRIFTPRAELPFAGHPNIATAFVLASRGKIYGRAVSDPLMFEEKAGLVRPELIREGGAVAGARLSAPQTLQRGQDVALDAVAGACAVEAGDIETANHQPCLASCARPLPTRGEGRRSAAVRRCDEVKGGTSRAARGAVRMWRRIWPDGQTKLNSTKHGEMP